MLAEEEISDSRYIYQDKGGVLDLLEVMIPNIRVLFLFVALIPPWSHGDS